MCWWPCANSAVSWCELIGSCRLNSLRSLELCGDFHTPRLQSALFPSVACCFRVALLAPRLTVTRRKKGTSRTFLSSSVCLLEMVLAFPSICFSINTRVQHLQDLMVLFEDSMVCCRCALTQLGINPSKALGCCWKQKEFLAKIMTITHREKRPGSCQLQRNISYLFICCCS